MSENESSKTFIAAHLSLEKFYEIKADIAPLYPKKSTLLL
jgi:hypothetical protein